MNKKKYYLLFLFLLLSKQIFSKENENFIQNFYFIYENDSVYGKDRYYSNGIQLFFFSKKIFSDENKFFLTIFDIKNKEFHNWTFGFYQQIFTSNNIEIKEFIENDRPYAGFLNFFLNKNIYHNNNYTSLGISVGCSGKCSLAEKTQKNVHNLIGSPKPQGWKYQIEDRFLTMFSILKIYNLNKKNNAFNWQLSPKIHINLGMPYTDIELGFEYKYGFNLEKNYLQNKIDTNQGGIFKEKKISYYIFFELMGVYDIYNYLLEGNLRNDYKSNINKYELKYNINFGLSFRYENFYIKYSNLFNSKEFKGQKENEIIFSLTLNYLI